MHKKLIKDYCESLGIDTIGFIRCRRFDELENFLKKRQCENLQNEFEEEDIEKRINPFLHMKEGKTIISIAFPYMHFKSKSLNKPYFSIYTMGMDYHKVLSNYLEKICSFIEGIGGKAKYFVDSNALPERYIAELSGIGFIGKNNMLINENYGSYIFLGEIITDLEIGEDNKVDNNCGNCDICLKACPTSAIKEGKSNPNICLSYITQKKDIEDHWFSVLDGRIFGCDICQVVCPYNKTAKMSSLKEFVPFDFMKAVDLKELLLLNKAAFKIKYEKTSCGWRGKNLLQRNALIYYFTKFKEPLNIKFNSPYINEYYNRLLKYFKL